VFDGLSFGFAATVNGEQVASVAYPPEGVVYLTTDQQWMTNDRIASEPGDTVSVSVWAVNGGVRREHEFSFETPQIEDVEIEEEEGD
jgi:hypothetical protein